MMRRLSATHLYDQLMRVPTKRGQGFVNMADGLDRSVSAVEPAVSYTAPTVWRALRCIREIPVGAFRVKTQCDSAAYPLQHHKLFVQHRHRLRNLYDYARRLQEGAITRADHAALVDFIRTTRRTLARRLGIRPSSVCVVNHNRDVDILHFKFRIDA